MCANCAKKNSETFSSFLYPHARYITPNVALIIAQLLVVFDLHALDRPLMLR